MFMFKKSNIASLVNIALCCVTLTTFLTKSATAMEDAPSKEAVSIWQFWQIVGAAETGDPEMIHKFLRGNKATNINARSFLHKETPLIHAVKMNNFNMVTALCGIRGIDINARDGQGRTALMWSVGMDGADDIFNFLLKEDKINLNIQDSNGCTTLMLAIQKNRTAMAQALLENRIVKIGIHDGDGVTAFMMAATNENLEICQALLSFAATNKADINVNAQSSLCKKTALIYAIRMGNPAIVKELLSLKGINVNTQDAIGKTALHYAIIEKKVGIIKHLLDKDDINITIKDNADKMPLEYGTKEIRDLAQEMLDQRKAAEEAL